MPSFEPSDDPLSDWARSEAKSNSTEQDLRTRYETTTENQRRKAGALLIVAGVLFIAWMVKSCTTAPSTTPERFKHRLTDHLVDARPY